MFGLVDALAILVLAGVGFAVSPTASLPAVVWIAFATPALARADVSRRRLPNALTLPAVALVAGCALPCLGVDTGAQEPRSALVALTATALAGWLVSRTGALGLGDVKLASALVGSVTLVAPAEVWVFAGVTAGVGAGCALFGSRGGPFGGAGAHRRLATLGIGLRGGPRRSSAAGRAGVVPEAGVGGRTGRRPRRRARVRSPYGPCLLLGYWSALLIEAVT